MIPVELVRIAAMRPAFEMTYFIHAAHCCAEARVALHEGGRWTMALLCLATGRSVTFSGDAADSAATLHAAVAGFFEAEGADGAVRAS